MRIAVVSDIHANLLAWNAVWADTRSQQIDHVICLGDIVGYGPRPAETLGDVYSKVNEFVLGNHDAAIAGKVDVSIFNDDAQHMIHDTATKLGSKAADFFNKLPYESVLDIEGRRILFVHASVPEPEHFYYIQTEDDARIAWEADEADLIFIGHTHQPRLDILDADGSYELGGIEDFVIDPSRRYIINVGSVGFPRIGDYRACYVVYDTVAGSVSWRLVNYDIDAFRVDVEASATASAMAANLLAFVDSADEQVREKTDFSKTQKLDDWFVKFELENRGAPANTERRRLNARIARSDSKARKLRIAAGTRKVIQFGKAHKTEPRQLGHRQTEAGAARAVRTGASASPQKTTGRGKDKSQSIVISAVVGAIILIILIIFGSRSCSSGSRDVSAGQTGGMRIRPAPPGYVPANPVDATPIAGTGSSAAGNARGEDIVDSFYSPVVNATIWKFVAGQAKVVKGALVMHTRDGLPKSLSTVHEFSPGRDFESSVEYQFAETSGPGTAGLVVVEGGGGGNLFGCSVQLLADKSCEVSMVSGRSSAKELQKTGSVKTGSRGTIKLEYFAARHGLMVLCGEGSDLKVIASKDMFSIKNKFRMQLRMASPSEGDGAEVSFDGFHFSQR